MRSVATSRTWCFRTNAPESVASLLTEVYDIPAENLVTQGYGERFLKVRTPEAEQQNRRVTIRRVTPLVRPVAQN
ncbi:hypothetical protein LP421_06715 [Rhizobium sp. RCAM05350]|nr:hypothetical protein LP421_06715 [Rhizobium sp. RCAM05350]